MSKAGEAITDTLSNALVINGLPDRSECFVVHACFNPAKIFSGLRMRLMSYDDPNKAQWGKKSDHYCLAMQAVRKKKEVSSSGCYVSGQKHLILLN